MLKPKITITLEEIAKRLEGELSGNYEHVLVSNVAGLKEAAEGDISFLAQKRHIRDLDNTMASAVVIPREMSFDRLPAIKVDNPYYAFSQLLLMFYNQQYFSKGVDDRAFIGKDVTLGNNISIYPFSYIADCVTIGDNVIIYPGSFIGEGSSVGSNSIIYPNVTIREDVTIGSGVIIHSGAVVGSDGFGYVFHKGIHHKIPQKGGVIIEDNVEIGANTTIDRGTLGNTVIKSGTKIDNLVQVAHNVTIGEDCIFAAQAGIAGSTTIGKRTTLAGQAGVTGHVSVGENVTVAGKAGVTKDIKDGQTVSGMPAVLHKDWLRTMAVFDSLPELRQKLITLENKVKELEKTIINGETDGGKHGHK